MVPRLLLCVLLVAASADAQILPVQPQPERWGLGVSLGAPFGVSLKRYVSSGDAFQLDLGLAYSPGFRLAGSYLFGVGRPTERPGFSLRQYVGIGPGVGVLASPCEFGFRLDHGCSGDLYVAARVPVGAELAFTEAPLAVGAELAPGVGVVRGRAGVLLDAALTLRFLF